MLTQRRRYEWVDFPVDPPDAEEENWNPEYAGFRAKLWRNPTQEDVEVERSARQAWDEIKTTEAMHEYLQVIADRVVEWEYEAENLLTGEVVPVRPPAEDWRTFLALPTGVLYWLLQLIPAMHLPKLKTIWLGVAGTTEKSTQSQIDPDPTPPANL